MENKLEIVVTKVTELDSIPAGSGLLLAKDSLYVISDNSPSLFKLDLRTYKYRNVPIKGMDQGLYELPKRTKPDLENGLPLTIKGKEYLLAFGSGSSPRREMLLIVEMGNENEQKRIPLNRLYAELRKRHDLSNEELNIEGVAACNGKIVLFLRKENMLVSIPTEKFIEFLEAPLEREIPPSKEQSILLPKHAGIFAGFSGATELVYNGKEAILFCASLEHTPNAIDDGPVSGSYVGLLVDNGKGKLELAEINLVRDQKGNILKDKIESLVITQAGTSSYKVVLVADNDNGRSRLFEANISIKQ